MSNEKWYWPRIADLPAAAAASNKGVWAAGIVAGTTLIVATLSLALSREIGGFGVWSYVDSVVWGLIAWGIHRRSRVSAMAGPVLFVVEKVFQLVAFGLGILGMAVSGFFLVLFVIGLKGTFAYHKFKSSPKIDEDVPGNKSLTSVALLLP